MSEIRTAEELHFYIAADRMINRGKFEWSYIDRLKHILYPDYVMRFLVAMRKTSYYNYMSKTRKWGGYFKLLFLWWYLIYRKLGVKLGFSIGYDSTGYALSLDHYGTIVLGGSSRIGNFAVLHTSTCIIDNEICIGDGLYLSTGAKLTRQKMKLGHNISVAANSVVTSSFLEDNVIIGGMPAVVIKKTLPWYIRDGKEYLRRFSEIENKHNLMRM